LFSDEILSQGKENRERERERERDRARDKHERRANGNQNLPDSTHCWELLHARTALVVYYN
jgi:hypothetical protein